MTIEILSFDGYNLNSADYSAWFPQDTAAMSRETNPITLNVIGGFPRDEGVDYKPVSFHIVVLIEGFGTGSFDDLMKIFRPGHAGELLVTFDGEQRVRDCRVERVQPYAGSPIVFVVNLIAADPRWRSLVPTQDEVSLTASGQSLDISNPGNAYEDKPVIVIKPTVQKAPADSWLYRRHAVIANRVKRSLTDWPIDITNGGFDHAALVAAGKSQADGDDVRVLVDGREWPRYFGEHADNDANSALTKVWTTPVWPAMQEAHLRAAITASVPANGGELEVLRGEVRPWPKSGFLLNPTSDEVIYYSGWTELNANGYSAFTGIRRAQMGTVAATGAANDRLIRAGHKVELIYGHTGIGAPESRPDIKPMLNIASSTVTNLRHEWVDWWDSTYPDRPGGWVRRFDPRDEQSLFILSNQGSPASEANFIYNYYNPPVDRDHFNILTRSIPTGTSGTGGQLQITRTVGATLMAEVRGVHNDGSAQLLERLKGQLPSGLFVANASDPMYEYELYVRSQVALSTPEMDGSPLVNWIVGAAEYTTVNAVNTTGNVYNAYLNETDEQIYIYGVQILVWQPNTPHTNLIVHVRPDDGAGAPGATGLSSIETSVAPTTPTWHTVIFDRPFPWAPNEKIHLNVQSGGGSSGVTYWGRQPMRHADSFPMHGVRWLAVSGPINEHARAEGGQGAFYTSPDSVIFDNAIVLLDSTATPYFALSAELDCYWLNMTIINETTEQELTFNLFVSTNDEIEIDVGKRTVTNLTTGETGLHVTPSDAEAWLSVVPGTNVLRFDEPGLVGADISIRHSPRWE